MNLVRTPITFNTDNVSFYRVPFACTVPGLGCGPLAKPVLLELERRPNVDSAWLYRLGTTLAVVWTSDSAREARHGVVNDVMRGRNFAELTGGDRECVAKSFAAGRYWYRGREVDRLTEEEARVIAFGLVREATTLVVLAENQARRLEIGLAEAIRDRLVNTTPEELGPGWAALRQAVKRRISR